MSAALQAEAIRIMASPSFIRAPVMRKLLSFLIEQTLGGHGDELKAYGVAVDGLGRPPEFDAQSDSYPRVQVGRLRKMIDQFYAENDAAANGMRLDIPSGGYRVFLMPLAPHASDPVDPAPGQALVTTDVTVTSAAKEADDGPEKPAAAGMEPMAPGPMPERGRRWPLWGVALLSLAVGVGVASAIWLLWMGGASLARDYGAGHLVAPPTLRIAPVRRIDGADGALARSVDWSLNDGLRRSWLVSAQQANLQGKAPDYVLNSVLAGASRPILMLSLSDSRSGAQIWSDRIAIADERDPMARLLSPSVTLLVSPEGIIGSHERRDRKNDDFSPGYPCMMAYLDLILNGRQGLRDDVNRCLARTVAIDPGYAPALSGQVKLMFRDALRSAETAAALRRESLLMAESAVAADPYSAEAHIALAHAAYVNGLCAQGRSSAKRGLALNPYDGFAQAYIGMSMYQCNDPEAETQLRMAWELEPGLPAVNALPVIMILAQRGEGGAALRFARGLSLARTGRKEGYNLAMATAFAAAGDRAKANAYWRAAATGATGRPDAPRDMVLARLIVTPGLAGRVNAFLAARGVPEAAARGTPTIGTISPAAAR